MKQTEARAAAHLMNEHSPGLGPYVATTICARRGEFEQGPDADQWVVVDGFNQLVEVNVP